MMKVSGIKCDAKDCNYKDDSVSSDNYAMFVNKPCPCCGANLLTEKDYSAFLTLQKIMNNPVIKLIDKVAGMLGSKPKHYEAEMNGSGSVKLKQVN